MKFSVLRVLVLMTVLLLLPATAVLKAQETVMSGKPGSAKNITAESADSVRPKRFIPTAWTLETPLGLHEPAVLDTLSYNYQRRAIPSMISDAYATTGNLGSEGIDMLYFGRKDATPFFFKDALRAWLPWFDTHKFYNVYIPMTLVDYNFAGQGNSKTDNLHIDFAGNVNRRIGIGVTARYLISKGCYENQAAKDFNVGLSGYYTGDRYEAQAFYDYYNLINKENGGITNPLYITDPAELQGGVASIEPKSIPVRLTSAQNNVYGQEFFMTHAYKLGFWKEEQVNDTLTRDTYVPVLKFIYSFDFQAARRRFVNSSRSQATDFWGSFYLNPDRTADKTGYLSLSNTIGISMIEGFQKWAQFGLSAYAAYEYRNYRQTTDFKMAGLNEDLAETLTPIPEGMDIEPSHKENILWIGGRLERTKGHIVNYMADVRFGLSGRQAGEIDLKGGIKTNIPLFGDTVAVKASGRFRNETPSWLLQQYVSNHFVWSNSFGKTRSMRVGGSLDIPWTRTRLGIDFENVQNRIYFTPESLPAQYGGSVQVFSASLKQDLKLGILNWNNTVTYQATSNKAVIPLPELTVYSNLFLGFTAFKVLHVQIGVDCDYYTRYRGINYQPATMTFHSETDTALGNFLLCNAYANFKLYKTRFYVLWSHLNRGWFNNDYFSMPCYPINPSRIQLGVAIDFAN